MKHLKQLRFKIIVTEYLPSCDYLLVIHLKTYHLRGCPCKNGPLDFRPKIKFLQIFCARQLVHVINKISNNLALSVFFNISGVDFRRRSKTVEIVMLRVKFRRCPEDAEKSRLYSTTIKLSDHFISCFFF